MLFKYHILRHSLKKWKLNNWKLIVFWIFFRFFCYAYRKNNFTILFFFYFKQHNVGANKPFSTVIFGYLFCYYALKHLCVMHANSIMNFQLFLVVRKKSRKKWKWGRGCGKRRVKMKGEASWVEFNVTKANISETIISFQPELFF